MFSIRSIPSILYVPMDGKTQMSVGALPHEVFVQAIEKIFKVSEGDHGFSVNSDAA